MDLITTIEDLKQQDFKGRTDDLKVSFYNGGGSYEYKTFPAYAEAAEFIYKNQKTPAGFHEILRSVGDVLTEKNKRYGSSALNPIKVFEGKSMVGQRADDKISRIKNSDVLRKNDICDLIGYLTLMCKENGWTDFSDQID